MESAFSGRIIPSRRIAAVDGLRGLLALMVLTWHVCAPFGLNFMLIPADAAVALFFVMSSYVLTRAWDGRIGVFLVRRLVRLWPVYAVCMAAGYIIAGVHPLWTEFFWYPLIGANDKPAIDPPVWSLFLEAWMMPFMPIVFYAGSGGPARAIFAIACLALAGFEVCGMAFHPAFVPATFVLGAGLARFDFKNRLLESSLPQWLGRISYSLYLSHALVLVLAVRAFGPWGGVAAVPVTFAVGWLVWRIIERPSIATSRAAGHAAGQFLSSFKLHKIAPSGRLSA